MKSFLRVASNQSFSKKEDERKRLGVSLFKRPREERIVRVPKKNNSEVVYVVKETIASGATAKVKRALRHLEKGQKKTIQKEVAMKLFKLDTGNPQIKQDFDREASILEFINRPRNRHPNIIKLYDSLRDVELKSKHGLKSSYDKKLVSGLVLEYVNGGELYNYLSTSTGIPMSIQFVRAVFQQLVRAISHLHSNNVVHLDIKPENVLLNKTGMVVLTDFGASQRIKKNHKSSNKDSEVDFETKEQVNASLSNCSIPDPVTISLPQASLKSGSRNSSQVIPKSRSLNHLNMYDNPAYADVKKYDPYNSRPSQKRSRRRSAVGRNLFVTSTGGTLKYRAPEVQTGELFDGAAADVWSLGVVLHVMLYNRVPTQSCLEKRGNSSRSLSNSLTSVHEHEIEDESYDFFQSGENDQAIKAAAADLLEHILCINPADRWTIKEIQSHPFVNASQIRGSAKVVAENVRKLFVYVDDAKKRKRMLRRKEREMKKSSSLTSLASLNSHASMTSLESIESAVSMP